MELKQWLNRGYAIAKKLTILKAHMESIGNVISNYEPREIEAMPNSNTSEANFIRWSELKKQVDELNFQLLKIDRETDKELRKLQNPNQYTVLYCRYIRRLSWRQISEVTRYSEQNTYKLHKDGVESLDRITCYKDWEVTND